MAISRQQSLWVSDVLSNPGQNSCLKLDAPAQAKWVKLRGSFCFPQAQAPFKGRGNGCFTKASGSNL